MAYRFQSASHQVLLVLLIFAAVWIAPSTSTRGQTFVVGDSKGWDQGVDYVAWAKGKTFHVGDKLVFKYAPSVHNVYKVTTKEQYQNCEIPNSQALMSGSDTVKLKSPGKKWFVCGVYDHCSSGNQKLEITVKHH